MSARQTETESIIVPSAEDAVRGDIFLSDESCVSGSCTCDPVMVADRLMDENPSMARSRDLFLGAGPLNQFGLEVTVTCSGPKSRLLLGQRCGATVATRLVELSDGDYGKSPEQTVGPEIGSPLETEEVLPGLTLQSLVDACINDADREQESGGLIWGDKAIRHNGLSPTLHIQVGHKDGEPVRVEFNEKNPFTPPEIKCNLSAEQGELHLRHHEAAHEGWEDEYFGLDERARFDARLVQLFKQYYVS